MNEFKEIRSAWQQRSIPEIPADGHRLIIKNSLYLNRKQLGVQVVLIVTILVLFYFLLRSSAFAEFRSGLGISLMIGTLLVRTGIEFYSRMKFKKLVPTNDFQQYRTDIIAFYKSRFRIHYKLTPLLFIIYVIGFIIMLPVFKAKLSEGFYNYIVLSSILIFISLILIILVQAKRELRLIKRMEDKIDKEYNLDPPDIIA